MLHHSHRADFPAHRAFVHLALLTFFGSGVSDYSLADTGIYFYAAHDAGVCMGDQFKWGGQRRIFRRRVAGGADRSRGDRRIIAKPWAKNLKKLFHFEIIIAM